MKVLCVPQLPLSQPSMLPQLQPSVASAASAAANRWRLATRQQLNLSWLATRQQRGFGSLQLGSSLIFGG